MPRSRSVKGTSCHPRDTGSLVVYMDEFGSLIEPSDEVMKTSEIRFNYMQYIDVLSGQSLSTEIKNQAFSGFARAFRTYAICNDIRQSTSPRGYYIKIKKFSRKSVIPESCVSSEGLINKGLISRKFIDTVKGYGVFAEENITKNVKLVQYRGQWITVTEHELRENKYAKENLPPVSIFSPSDRKMLDGNVDENGRRFEIFENIARFFNHSKQSPKCKLVVEDTKTERKLYLVSKMPIAKGCELTWDYNVKDRNSIRNCPWLSE